MNLKHPRASVKLLYRSPGKTYYRNLWSELPGSAPVGGALF